MKAAQLEYKAGFEATRSPTPGSYNALTGKMVLVPPPPPSQVGVRPRPGNEIFHFQSLSDWWGRESKGAKPTRARENKDLCLSRKKAEPPGKGASKGGGRRTGGAELERGNPEDKAEPRIQPRPLGNCASWLILQLIWFEFGFYPFQPFLWVGSVSLGPCLPHSGTYPVQNYLGKAFGVYSGGIVTCPLLWVQVRLSWSPPSPTERASGLPQLVLLSPL